MTTMLTEAGGELFDRLTSCTFYVVDTEYTAAGAGIGGNSIISIAIVPVIQGRRVEASAEFYREMNPGVSISAASSQVHGFTDANVKGKRDFAYYAPRILAALDDPEAVFVAHTAADIRALREELLRLDARKASGDAAVTVGLSDLPDLPIIDTSTLAKQLRYPGLGQSGIISLARLCELTGVINKTAHDARSDARATADALVELLAHASQNLGVADLPELLSQHNAGSTHEPRGPIHIRERRESDPLLSDEHIAKHLAPLTDVATKSEILAWVELARECATLRCQWLVDEARVAGNLNAPALLDKVAALLPGLTEPGQAGTLIGAIAELINPMERDGAPGLAYTRAIHWWRKFRQQVNASVVCGVSSSQRCPACRKGEACPRDTLYQVVAIRALLGKNDPLTQLRIIDLFRPHSPFGLYKWAISYPEIAAFAAWYVIAMEQREIRSSAAANHLVFAMETGLHLLEPRLALLACEMLVVSHQANEAISVANSVLKTRTTDEGYEQLDQWLMLTQQSLKANAKVKVKTPSEHPRLARPRGRVNPNPYNITETR